MKNFTKFMFYLMVLISLPSIAQQSMNLGDLKFVMPSSDVSASVRTLSMKMATTGISPKIYAKVGGVAFIQTAIPNFTVNSLSLDCDYEKNSARVVINDSVYRIPLEVWELQTIVNYANSDDNAAVTLFGDSESRIKYHSAFLDNLMGLRVLHSDMMLTSTDVWRLPSYENGEYIMSMKEKELYDGYNDIYSLLFDLSYEEISYISNYEMRYYIDSIGEKYDTYIYTDYGTPITFGVENGEIVIDGDPYYRFAYRDSVLVDTLEMYYLVNDYIEMYNNKSSLYKKLCVSDMFDANLKKIKKIIKSTNSNKIILNKSKEVFEMLDYYALCDTFDVKDRLYSYWISEIVKESLGNYADSIVNNGCGNFELYNVCKEYLSVKNDFEYYDYPIVSEYVNYISEMIPSDSTIFVLKEICSKCNMTYDKLLIDYLYENRIPAVIEAQTTTDFVRNNYALVYRMNPIVYNATEKLCKWSAFFRYVKENHNEEWMTFVSEVTELRYDAPEIITPIDFE